MIGKMLAVGFVCVGIAGAQTAGTSTASATLSAKAYAFDVVSIRENISAGVHDDFGTTADGFRVINKPVLLAIITAYVPQSSDNALFTNNVIGLPEWAQRQNYDIVAKVSEADLAEWGNPARQKPMLRAMMQSMLADRFKLVVHRETKDESVFSLVVGKNGPKFQETNLSEPHPGLRLPGGGGVMVPEDSGHSIHFYEASMATLASLLSGSAGRPVLDRTGLTGRYDFVLQKPESKPTTSADPQEVAEPQPTVFSVVEALGLKLEPAKGSTETLVIDRIERPSQN